MLRRINKNNNGYVKAFCAAAICAVALSGCASFKATEDSIQQANSEASESFDRLAEKRVSGAVTRHTSAKLGGQEITIEPQSDLPPVFNTTFSYLSVGERLSPMLSEIARRTGMSVTVQPSLKAQLDRAERPMSLEWSGTLKGLFDYIANNRDIYWRYNAGVVHFYKTDTQVFNVFLPSGKRSVSSNISLSSTGGGSTGGGDGGGSGEVSVSGTASIDAYEALTKAVELIVSQGDPEIKGVVRADPTLGTLTVSSTPDVLRQVAQFVKTTNDRFAQNVLINVRVLNLSLKRDASRGISSDVVFDSLTRQLNARLVSPALLQPSVTPGQLIVGGAIGANGEVTGTNIIEALEQVGRVSIVTSGQIVAANGQPSPFQAANDITYVSGSTTSQAANVGQTTTIETDTLTVGFTANFLPLILGDNRIMLQYQINLSTLLSLDQIGTADALIQTPNIAKQTLHQQAFLRDGESIVLFGYEQERAAQTSRRGFSSASKAADGERNMLVIILEVFGGK